MDRSSINVEVGEGEPLNQALLSMLTANLHAATGVPPKLAMAAFLHLMPRYRGLPKYRDLPTFLCSQSDVTASVYARLLSCLALIRHGIETWPIKPDVVSEQHNHLYGRLVRLYHMFADNTITREMFIGDIAKSLLDRNEHPANPSVAVPSIQASLLKSAPDIMAQVRSASEAFASKTYPRVIMQQYAPPPPSWEV